MKQYLALAAVAGLAVACGKVDNDHHHANDGHHHPHPAPHAVVAPAPVVTPGTYVTPSGAVVRQDGTYRYDNRGGVVAVPGTVVEDRGYQHKHSDDALSERSLGATRGSHGQPMTHKDSDHDGNYDYVPSYRTRPATYYYAY